VVFAGARCDVGNLVDPDEPILGGDPARIDANVAEAAGGRFDQKFGDYLLMYSALAGEQQREASLARPRSWTRNGLMTGTVGPTCWPG
jgi:hypothetical protein